MIDYEVIAGRLHGYQDIAKSIRVAMNQLNSKIYAAELMGLRIEVDVTYLALQETKHKQINVEVLLPLTGKYPG